MSKPEPKITSVRFLTLTDEDLRALGAVAAHWALAEQFTNSLLCSLVGIMKEWQ